MEDCNLDDNQVQYKCKLEYAMKTKDFNIAYCICDELGLSHVAFEEIIIRMALLDTN